MKLSSPIHRASRITHFCFPFLFCVVVVAAEIDATKLPSPAKIKVEFDRDIKPIFEKSCLRCHGPEKPKSRFRLDNRASALKGGENGIDIIPGNSAKSPFIHYVARLVEDMEMPPPGKGDPLTLEQIGLLRAWIDQDANWPDTFPLDERGFVFAPTLRWIHVQGDEKKFRENEGMHEGWATGIEQFSLTEQVGTDRKFSAEGRTLFQDHDYQLYLKLEKTDVGFISGGVEQWRTYYDDSGGYYRPFGNPSSDLDRNLFLDSGQMWINFGLSLPNWPQMVLGYEYQFKNGNESTLEWGNLGGTSAFARNILPAARSIDERTHIVKFELVHDIYDWHLEESARVEFFNLRTERDDVKNPLTLPPPEGVVQTREGSGHVEGQNTVRLERQVNDWVFLSGGYLYSRFDGDASMQQVTLDQTGVLTPGLFWFSDDIVLKRETHSFSVAGQLMPEEGLSVSLGLQPEWTHQEGFGNVQFSEGDLSDPSFLAPPATLRSDLDTQKFSEQFSVRYTKFPWTVLFAEARWEQEQIGQFEHQVGDETILSAAGFLRRTDFTNDRTDYRFGFNTSPWRRLSFSAYYKSRVSNSGYDNFKLPSNSEGYSAFIRGRRIDTDELQTKLVLRPADWLKTTLTYQRVATEYETATDPVSPDISPGGTIVAANYYANVYSANATLTPFRRLYLSATFSYSDARTVTAQNDNPSVVPYKGDIYTIISSATFAVNESTDLQATYTFSRAKFDQNNVVEGLPLGLNYVRHGVTFGATKRLTPNLSTNLRYALYQYDEPSSGGVNNYTAHGVFATLTMRWP